MTKVDIVIVNWNSGGQLRQCVDSIFKYEDPTSFSLVVIDNASRDGSADFLRAESRVRLIESGRNLGFGSACNMGAAYGRANYVLFLNPDTRFLGPTLASVTAFMDQPSSAKVGVCGIRLISESGTTAKHCARHPSAITFFNVSSGLSKFFPRFFLPVELLEFDHIHDAVVPHVMGAFFLIRRSVFDLVCGFDEAFFVYYEDLDLSYRVRQSGYATCYLASTSIFHRTGGTSRGARAKALSYLLESRLIYARKHFNFAGRALVVAGVFAVEPIRRIVHALLNGSISQAGETIEAMKRLWATVLGNDPERY